MKGIDLSESLSKEEQLENVECLEAMAISCRV